MPIEPSLIGGRWDGARGREAPALPAPAHASHHWARPPPPAAGPDIGLLLAAVRRRLPLILALALLGGGLGYGVQRWMAPRFTSSVSLILEPRRSDSFGADTSFGNVLVDEAKIASVVSVIESSDLLGRVVSQERLDEVSEFGDAAPSRLGTLLAALHLVAPPVIDDSAEARAGRALDKLERSLRIDRVGVTYVVTISASARDPEIAQRIATAVANVYLRDQVERKVTATERDSAWLEARLGGVRHDLEQSEAAVDAIRRKYGLLETDSSPGATLDRQALTGLNAQVTQAQAELAGLRARSEQLRSRSGNLGALAEVAGSPLLTELRTKQSESARQIAALRASYGDNYPQLRRLGEEARSLQGQIDAEMARISEGATAAYEAALTRERTLRAQLQRAIAVEGAAAGDQGHEELRNAQRLLEENRGLYGALVTTWRGLQEQHTREEPEARIISRAEPPGAPNFPKWLILPISGFAAFGLLGLCGTLVPVLLDKRIASATAAEQKLGLPVLGAVPLLRRRDLQGGKAPASRGAGRGGRGQGPRLVEVPTQQPLSHFAESLRMVRAFLHIGCDGPATVLHVTSALPGEGKSTVAAALAVSAASAGVHTVLVDADLRASSVTAMFGLQNEIGLADVLEKGLPLHAALHGRGDLALSVLGAGTAPTSRPDMLDSGRFAALVRELAASHRLVILDSPPVLPVSDALVIARHADAVVLVVEWQATRQDVAQQAIKLLRSVGAPLAGLMLNKIDAARVARYERGYADRGAAAAGRTS